MVGELVRRRDVTKVRDGGKWRKRIREAPEELDGVGDAFSCSFEPDHDKKCHQGVFLKISPGFSCLPWTTPSPILRLFRPLRLFLPMLT